MNLYRFLWLNYNNFLPSFSERFLEKHLYKNGGKSDPFVFFPAIGKLPVILRDSEILSPVANANPVKNVNSGYRNYFRFSFGPFTISVP